MAADAGQRHIDIGQCHAVDVFVLGLGVDRFHSPAEIVAMHLIARCLVDYNVDTAHDGDTALDLVRRKNYDVALLDLKMPGMDGLALYRAIRKLCSQTVAIIVSAYASGGTRDEALAAGAWHVIPRPADFRKLLDLIEEALVQPLVMVVDDDPDLCDSLWDVMRERGYRIAIAHDQANAARKMSDASFQVVLIDMKLPGGPGLSSGPRRQSSGPNHRHHGVSG